MHYQGRIASWNSDRGFGFIETNDGTRRVFVHIKAFPRNHGEPTIGTAVSFDIQSDDQGRPRAENVKVIGFSGFSSANRALAAGVMYLGFVAAVALMGGIHIAVLGVYAALSIITFACYAIDKASAQGGERRISENTLNALALLGGWPGALYAQQLLRHKSSKLSFRVTFWIAAVANVAVLCYLIWPLDWLAKALASVAHGG